MFPASVGGEYIARPDSCGPAAPVGDMKIMSVDGKDELAAGAGVRAAVTKSFSRVFLTLLDTHVTSFIAAAFLLMFGTGPIRGFALTLMIGLAANLFTSIFVSKTLFEAVLSGQPAKASVSI